MKPSKHLTVGTFVVILAVYGVCVSVALRLSQRFVCESVAMRLSQRVVCESVALQL